MRLNEVPVEVSARHVHLNRSAIDSLFGPGYMLTPRKMLSQPGQYLAKERVDLVYGDKSLTNVAVLGPERSDTQIEISATDARYLGMSPPIRLSGDVRNSPGMIINSGGRTYSVPYGTIIAARHLHLSAEEGLELALKDKDIISLDIPGIRGGRMYNVVCRVGDGHKKAVHIDTDEANGYGISVTTTGYIVNCNDE